MFGLSGAVVLAAFAVLFLEGTIRWVILGIAVLDAVVTPRILKRTVENAEDGDDDIDEYGFAE